MSSEEDEESLEAYWADVRGKRPWKVVAIQSSVPLADSDLTEAETPEEESVLHAWARELDREIEQHLDQQVFPEPLLRVTQEWPHQRRLLEHALSTSIDPNPAQELGGADTAPVSDYLGLSSYLGSSLTHIGFDGKHLAPAIEVSDGRIVTTTGFEVWTLERLSRQYPQLGDRAREYAEIAYANTRPPRGRS